MEWKAFVNTVKIKSADLKNYRSELSKVCPATLVQYIRAKIQEVNSKLFNPLHQIKDQKLQQLTAPQITCDLSLESRNTVVTIPENLSAFPTQKNLSSVRAWILFLYPKNWTNSQLNKMSKNSFAAFNLKHFSMTKRMILTPR